MFKLLRKQKLQLCKDKKKKTSELSSIFGKHWPRFCFRSIERRSNHGDDDNKEDDDDEDISPESKVQRERLRRQANNARER